MATLPYMQFYFADYLKDTPHFDTDEHGAYFLLIINYYQTEKPIPEKRVRKITGLSVERWPDAEQTLIEFFEVKNGFWRHPRIENDLRRVKRKVKSASEAGKKSAESRRKKAEIKQEPVNNRSATVQPCKEKRVKSKDIKKDNSSKSDDSNARFETFWKGYKRKDDKKRCRVTFCRLTVTNQKKAIEDSVERFKDTDRQFVPMPRTYMNGERWNDEVVKHKERIFFPARNDCNAWVAFAAKRGIKTKVGEMQFDFERRVRNTIDAQQQEGQ